MIYKSIRAAVFILLPVYFYTRPFMPRPLQIMLLAFGLAVVAAELSRLFVRDPVWIRRLGMAPFWAGAGSIYPYLSQIAYFDTGHQVLIGAVLLMGLLYWAESRISVK